MPRSKHKPRGLTAVMNKTNSHGDNREDFPTPPWATRALVEYVIPKHLVRGICLEPAAGRGLMSDVLAEYFDSVWTSDKFDYGLHGCTIQDYLDPEIEPQKDRVDWTITNSPFKRAAEFLERALIESEIGVAMLLRSNWTETPGRYYQIFERRQPTIIGYFSERVTMYQGRWDPSLPGGATAYNWFVWIKGMDPQPPMWIPPCKKRLSYPSDIAFMRRFPVAVEEVS